MTKFKSFIAKIKSVKNIEIYVAAVLGLVVVENIEGCGKVAVAISHDAYEEKVYAYEKDKNPDGTEISTVVLVKGEPLVIKTLPPNILGVVIVAEGADNPIIKMKIKEVVVTLLDVDVSKVQVFTHKS